MYLTDREIRRRLPEFEFAAEPGFDEFAEDQIGPCSVDLRLSSVYWQPEPPRPWRLGRPLPIDLTRGRIMEANPTRGWRRVSTRITDVLVLRPGQMILARTCESFKVPADCAGALEGRSSVARLGLSVHATGGFINPGYHGRMPLTLVNHSPFTLRVPVGFRLCQLMLIPLSEVPKQDYSMRDPKYLPDYGGPSYWWRDVAVKKLHNDLSAARFDADAIDKIVDTFTDASYDYAVYERMENFLSATKPLGTADDLLTAFSHGEDRRAFIAKCIIRLGRAALPLWAGVTIPLMITSDVPLWAAVLSGVLAAGASLWGVWQSVPAFLTTKRLRQIQRTSPH